MANLLCVVFMEEFAMDWFISVGAGMIRVNFSPAALSRFVYSAPVRREHQGCIRT
jgi:hypothetical protein